MCDSREIIIQLWRNHSFSLKTSCNNMNMHKSTDNPNGPEKALSNMLFPSSKKSHFQNEAKCKTFVVKMSFISMTIKNHFHINGFALNLALKVRLFGTRKWPILLNNSA